MYFVKIRLSSVCNNTAATGNELNSWVHKCFHLLIPSSVVRFVLRLVFQVYRLPVQDCHKYSDCEKCAQARDPYCGWCVREGRWVSDCCSPCSVHAVGLLRSWCVLGVTAWHGDPSSWYSALRSWQAFDFITQILIPIFCAHQKVPVDFFRFD